MFVDLDQLLLTRKKVLATDIFAVLKFSRSLPMTLHVLLNRKA